MGVEGLEGVFWSLGFSFNIIFFLGGGFEGFGGFGVYGFGCSCFSELGVTPPNPSARSC